jgi:PIF1-like helicase
VEQETLGIECSMLLAETFSYIYRACLEADMGLILVGDFLQLQPVVKSDVINEHGAYLAFESKYWSEFTNGTSITDGSGIIRLSKNHRQKDGNEEFLKFLSLLRVGDGEGAA